MSKDLASLESGGTDLGISTVKVGADGKERAVLLRKSSVRWICLVFVALLLGGGGAWYVYRERQVHAAEMDRLTRLLRSTGERVQSLQRVQDRLEASKSTDEVKEQVAKEMHLGSEVRDAEVDHARAQAAMMKRGLPSGEHQAAADKAALQVPKEMQRKMINEFQLKSSFLVWATTAEREAAWRKSPHFDKKLSDAQSDRLDNLEEMYEDGGVSTSELIGWLRANITAGLYPPAINPLTGISGYLADLTDEPSLFERFDLRKKKVGQAHAGSFKAAEAMLRKIVALIPAEAGDPSVAFKQIYAALVQFHMTEWLFPADDPFLDDGVGEPFAKLKAISESEEDDDDAEDELEFEEEDDDEAE